MQTIHSSLEGNHKQAIAADIPGDAEIQHIANRMHTACTPCLETIRGYKVTYRSRQTHPYSTQFIDPFTCLPVNNPEPHAVDIPAEFTFGYGCPRKIVLSWSDGDNKPPKWIRYG